MNVQTLHEARNEGSVWRPNWRTRARDALIAAVAGLFLAWVGAFETHDLPMPRRVVFWVTGMIATSFVGGAAMALARRYLDIARRPWSTGAMAVAIMTLPITGFVALWIALFFGASVSLRVLPGLVPSAAIMSAVMTAIFMLLHRPFAVTHATPGAAPSRFLDRLPPKLKGAILYAVEAEDHYLRLHTSKGSDLILMRLSDAIAELEGLEGAQTHRSWWVANNAVTEVKRQDGKVALRLTNNAEAPVSRANIKPLREAGWL